MNRSWQVDYTIADAPPEMEPAVREYMIVGLRNTGREVWKGVLAHSSGNVSLAYHWNDSAGNVVVWDDSTRSPILADVPPGGEAVLFLGVTPPDREGRFVLQLSLVDGEAWFEQRGAKTHEIPVVVRSPLPVEREAIRERMLRVAELDDAGEEMREFALAQGGRLYGAGAPQRSYVKLNARRYALTARILQEKIGIGPRCLLNIGFSPVWSLLVGEHLPAWEQFDSDIKRGGFFVGEGYQGSGERRVEYFNAEKDRFPYEDGSFDVVVAPELLEHLVSDPMFMIAEINRILASKGCLVLTTPNVARLDAVASLLEQGGRHPFTFSPYVEGGHHREYMPLEVRLLLLAGGFDVEFFGTYNVWPFEWPSTVLERTLALIERDGYTMKWREQDIVAIGRKAGPVRWRRPYPLYLTPDTSTVLLEAGYE